MEIARPDENSEATIATGKEDMRADDENTRRIHLGGGVIRRCVSLVRRAARHGAARRTSLVVLARAFPGRFGALVGLVVIAGALPGVFAVLVGRLVSTLSDGAAADPGRVTVVVIWMGVCLLLQEVCAGAQELLVADLYRRFDEHLLARVIRASTSLSQLDLFDDPLMAAQRDRAARAARFGPGELVSGISAKWTKQAGGLTSALLVAWYWPLAGVLLAVLWIIAGWGIRASYYRANPFWTDPLRRSAYFKNISLMPEWAKELRIYGLSGWLADRFGKEWASVMAELLKARRIGQPRLALLALVLLASHVVILFSLVPAAEGVPGIGADSMVVVLQGLIGMAALASQHGDIWIENGAVPIPDVLTLEREVAGRERDALESRRAILPSATGDIRFENVHFAYPGQQHSVLEGFDLTIPAGQSLAIVGLNGAGKTTLIKLLTRLARPQKGVIRVSDTDLNDVDPTEWRKRIAVVFQDFVHYPMPVRENIGFGAIERLRSLGADDFDSRVRAAARLAGADEIIDDMPFGLDTLLSRRYTDGVDISGGQWQRLALARAMLAVDNGAQLIVMDEPTAHLDVRAEADLYNRFLDLTRGLTTVIISHRFSAVRRADRIVVLQAGRLVEDGTHDELMRLDGTYARLFARQAARYTSKGTPAGGSFGG